MGADSIPEDRAVAVNGLKLHYLDWGNPDAPALLLLHGLGNRGLRARLLKG